MDTFQGGAVVLRAQRQLQFGDHQYLGATLWREYRPLVGREMAVARTELVEPAALVLRLVLITAVSGVVDLQPRHLVETDHPIHRITLQIGLHPGNVLLVTPLAGKGAGLDNADIEIDRALALPAHGVDPDAMTALLADLGDAQEIPLQAAKGEIFIQYERQLHRGSLGQGSESKR